MARLLAVDLLASHNNSSPAINCHAATLRRVVQEILQKNEPSFTDMITSLSSLDAIAVYVNICNAVLCDGQVNWGRIAVLFTFGYALAQHAAVNEDMASAIGDFVCERAVSWVVRQGGWSSMDRFFKSPNV